MSIRALRVVLIVHALAIFSQAALAGRFLSGDDSAVLFHQVAGWIIPLICLVQILAGIKLVHLSFTCASVVVFLCEGLQIGTGYGRFLNVHIPLSVVIAGVVVGQLVWTYRKQQA